MYKRSPRKTVRRTNPLECHGRLSQSYGGDFYSHFQMIAALFFLFTLFTLAASDCRQDDMEDFELLREALRALSPQRASGWNPLILEDFELARRDKKGVSRYSCQNYAVYEAVQLLRAALPSGYNGERVRLENNPDVDHLKQCAEEFGLAVLCTCDDKSVDLRVYDDRTLLVFEKGHPTIEVDISKDDGLNILMEYLYPSFVSGQAEMSNIWYSQHCTDADVYQRAMLYTESCHEFPELCKFVVRMNAMCALRLDIVRVKKGDTTVAVFTIDGMLKTLVDQKGETKHHSISML